MTKVTTTASATDKLAAKGFAPKATGKATEADTSATDGEIAPKILKTARAIVAWWWGKSQPYALLGIRENTALRGGVGRDGTLSGTRPSMLAVAAYGYETSTEAMHLARAVRKLKFGTSTATGGISFSWMVDVSNMQTITPNATIRLDATDGKMRLMPLPKGTGKSKPASVKPTGKIVAASIVPAKVKDDSRANGAVTVTKMTADELAALNAEADAALATA